MRSGLCLWMRAHRARPSFQLSHEKRRKTRGETTGMKSVKNTKEEGGKIHEGKEDEEGKRGKEKSKKVS